MGVRRTFELRECKLAPSWRSDLQPELLAASAIVSDKSGRLCQWREPPIKRPEPNYGNLAVIWQSFVRPHHEARKSASAPVLMPRAWVRAQCLPRRL